MSPDHLKHWWDQNDEDLQGHVCTNNDMNRYRPFPCLRVWCLYLAVIWPVVPYSSSIKFHVSSPAAGKPNLVANHPWRPEYACAAFTLEEENKAREMGAYFQNPDTKQACYTRLDAKGGSNRIPLVQVSFKMQISWRPVSVVQLAWNLEMREAGEAVGRFPFYLYPPAYLKDCSSTQIKQETKIPL